MDIGLVMNLVLVALLVLLTAFFVGAEFAVIKVRISRIDQLITEGNKSAVAAKRVVERLDYYLSACQLGITVTALGLGALGEPTIEKMLHPVFNQIGIPESFATPISYILALSLMTFLHVVLGEMAPKTMAIQFAERMTLLLAPPLVWFGKVTSPFIWLLNGSAQLFLRMFGVKPAGHEQAHSEEELKIIMTQSFQSGEINQTELSYMQNIFAFDERVARDVMVPRRQITTLSETMSREEILQAIDSLRYTRYPITENGDKDSLIGYMNAKEYMTNVLMGRGYSLRDHAHPMEVVFETTPLQNVLHQMQKRSVHMAAVIDEYGGTAGIITMEDILEEIVGEIRDEFDQDETAEIVQTKENEYLISGRVLLASLEDRFGTSFERDADHVDTIGGWLQLQLSGLDKTVRSVRNRNQIWSAIEMDNRQIVKVSLVIEPEA
ncbi:hemolysin family protein [Gorillibacterium sp. CAU 1737]|uniref:hemolysin family protein n=1 Tax=Gorillibacterium sp. CAU 1737 TaxID=3140362 RepID=UPI003261048B